MQSQRNSMTPSQITLGAVFETNSSPYQMRVIAHDETVVMYDTWWPHRGAWAMSGLRVGTSYCRMPRSLMESGAKYVRLDPLSERELQVHRPDLPFAVAQREDLSWYDQPWPTSVFGTEPVLSVGAIYLAPFGPRDTSKSSSLITAKNGAWFSEDELLARAMELQRPLLGNIRLTDGVGIYRAGIRNKTPSYYIWGARSRLGAPAKGPSHMARLL